MSINRRVRFDGGIINGSPALTVLHQRGMPGQYSYDETGTQVSGPRYARRKLICSAPKLESPVFDDPIVVGTGLSGSIAVWGGARWDSTTPCLVEFRDDGQNEAKVMRVYEKDGASFLIVKETDLVRTLSSSTVTDLLSENPDADWAEEPLSVGVADGLTVVACRSLDVSSGISVEKGISFCWLNENVSPAEWHFIARSPIGDAADAKDLDRPRAASWMITGPWCLTRDGNPVTEAYFAMVDYRQRARTQPGGDTEPRGGYVMLLHAQRSGSTVIWPDTAGTDAVPPEAGVVYHATFPDYYFSQANGNPGGSDLADPRDKGMHIHSASVIFPDEGGMVVTIMIGDSAENNRTVKLAREDLNFLAGPAEESAWDEYPTNEPTDNGWTTYEDAEGGRRRIHITSADAAPTKPDTNKLRHPKFANYTHPGGVTPFRYGTFSAYASSTGITGKDGGDASGETAIFTDDLAAGTRGMVVPNNSLQGIAQSPLQHPGEVLLGGDEHMCMIYKIRVTDGESRLTSEIAYGVPPEILLYNNSDADNLWYQSPRPGQDVIPNWNCFLIACALPQQGRHYAATVHPGSIALWNDTTSATFILYSDSGWEYDEEGEPVADEACWGDMFLCNENPSKWFPAAFFGTEKFFVPLNGGIAGLTSIPMPVAWKARPISISGGGSNKLYATGSPPELGFVGSNVPSPQNTVEVVDPADLASAYGLPRPPCFGPIMRVTSVNKNYLGVLQLTATNAVQKDDLIRIRLWVCVLAPDESRAAPNDRPFAATGASIKLQFGYNTYYGTTMRKSRVVEFRPLGARQWVPVVLTTRTSEWTESNPDTLPNNFTLVAELKTSGDVVNRQDMLIAWDHVITDAVTPQAPGQPMRITSSSTPATTEDEKLSISGFGCQNNWTMYIVARVPNTGADINTALNGWPAFDDGNPTTTGMTAFTLRESSGKFLRVIFDRTPLEDGTGKQIAANRLLVVDHNGNVAELTGPTFEAAEGRTLEQPFLFLKGKQVLFAITFDDESDEYTIMASVGGTQVASLTTGELVKVKPTAVYVGDENQQKIDPIEPLGIWCDNNNATTEANGRIALETLNFWDA